LAGVRAEARCPHSPSARVDRPLIPTFSTVRRGEGEGITESTCRLSTSRAMGRAPVAVRLPSGAIACFDERDGPCPVAPLPTVYTSPSTVIGHGALPGRQEMEINGHGDGRGCFVELPSVMTQTPPAPGVVEHGPKGYALHEAGGLPKLPFAVKADLIQQSSGRHRECPPAALRTAGRKRSSAVAIWASAGQTLTQAWTAWLSASIGVSSEVGVTGSREERKRPSTKK